MRDPQTAMQLRPLQYCVNKNRRESTLNYELYFYLNTVNLSDKIIIIKITIYCNLYKHDLKI